VQLSRFLLLKDSLPFQQELKTMFGIPSSVSPTQEFEAANHSRENDPNSISTRKIKSNSGGVASGRATDSGSGEDFARRLEAALGAVSGRSLPGRGGKDLPAASFAAHALGDSTNLITAADVEPTPEEALYALALSQGLDPDVVAAVLWPAAQAPDGLPGLLQSTEPDAGGLSEGSAGDDTGAAHSVWDGAIPPWLAGSRLGVGQFAIGAGTGSTEADRTGASSNPWISERHQPAPIAGAPDDTLRLRDGLAFGASVPSTGSFGLLPRADGTAPADFNRGHSQSGPVPSPSGPMEGGSPMGESALKSSILPLVGGSLAESAKPTLDAAALSPRYSASSVASVQSGLNATEHGQAMMSEEATIQAERATALRSLLANSGARLRTDLSSATEQRSGGAVKQLDIATVLPAAQWMLRHARGDAILNSSGAAAAELNVMYVEEAVFEATPAESETLGDVRLSPLALKPETIDLSAEEGGVSTSSRMQADREGLQQRMSEALAQRIVAQASRGQWSLQLELKPAELGQISIEMTMNNGRLEALFEASSPAARSLIAEGFDRLRQELERIGTNVASLSMQNAFGGSPGGKPTPGRPEKRAGTGGESDFIQAGVAEGLATQSRTRDDRRLDLMV
jgi:hypothetical protein